MNKKELLGQIEDLQKQIKGLDDQEKEVQEQKLAQTEEEFINSFPEKIRPIISRLIGEQGWDFETVNNFVASEDMTKRFFTDSHWENDSCQVMETKEELLTTGYSKLTTSYDEAWDLTVFDCKTGREYSCMLDVFHLSLKI